jgi:hypothetical protein
LLCLKDPAHYYGKPRDNTIDILNIAVNAEQAKNVFFKNFKILISGCRWFDGKYRPFTQNAVEFDKSINLYSGHSERESFEGLNLFVAVLDEISAFALDKPTTADADKPDETAKTAHNIYKMYRASVDSRFADFGKVILLSFPRFKGDYIQQAYERVIKHKEVVIRHYTLKLDPDLPDGIEGNEFDIQWEEDHIVEYEFPKIFALRRPSWEVNPTINIDSPAIVRAFAEDPGDALGRYACMPSNITDGFFKNKQAIQDSFVAVNGVDENGIFLDRFKGKPGVKYYIHVDLAQKHDHCAVAMAHVDRWIDIRVGSNYSELHPVVVVDAVRWWTPTKTKSVEFSDVREYIVALRRRGFDIRLVTFDRWNSHDTMNILEREHGMLTDTVSVDKKHYDDFLSVMYDHRLVGPNIELLKTELGELRQLVRGTKVVIDHPRKGSKDLSDAVCGAIFNAVEQTPKPINTVVEVVTHADLVRKSREEAERERAHKADGFDGVIRAPRREPPPDGDIRSYLARIL